MTSRFWIWIWLLAIAWSSQAFADTLDDALESYQAAMATVERGPRLAKFREAENLFRRALEGNGQPAGADLYVNIGNAALEAGRVGHAVVAYHQAMTVDPGHRQANANLAFVRSTLPEWLHPTEAYSRSKPPSLDTFAEGDP